MVKVALLGGDERQNQLAKELRRRGYTVAGFGNAVEDRGADLAGTLNGARVVILPVPATRNGVFLSQGAAGAEIAFSQVLALLEPGVLLLGALFPPAWIEAAKECGAICLDYYREETVQLRNALPTAEGALRLAMQELPVTLFGVETAVVGYGRIGSLLCEKLIALGAKVGVLARAPAALAQAELHGARIGAFSQGAPPFFRECRVLFNTVPERVLSRPFLQALPENCILIELASAPGGFDPALAKELGFRVVTAQGLPGRFYPETAGKILADAVCAILEANGFSH